MKKYFLFLRIAFDSFKFSTTPPISKKNQNGPESLTQSDVFSLTKSKSHESQLVNRLENGESASRYNLFNKLYTL